MIENYIPKQKVLTASTATESNVFIDRISFPSPQKLKIKRMLENVDTNYVLNTKEIMSFSLIEQPENIPKDIFNILHLQTLSILHKSFHLTCSNISVLSLQMFSLLELGTSAST